MSTHFGMDVAAREGAPVLSTADGVVTFADWDQDLGWLVEIDHGYDVVTRYGHNSRLRVDSGQLVHRGQIIALVGNTGRSSGPHLHYEVIENGKKINSQTLKLPSGKILKGKVRENFEVERIKLDVLKSEIISSLN